MAIKKILKDTYKIIPFKKQIFSFVKLFYKPSENIYRHLYFNGVFKVKTEGNKSFKIIHYGYQIENEIFWEGLDNGFEKVSIDLWKKLSAHSNYILDIGANTGIFSLIAKSINNEAKIHAFEPIHFTCEILKKNIQLNHYQAECHEIALSNFCGTAEVFLPEDANMVYSVTVNKNLNAIEQKTKKAIIDTTTLDDFIEKNNIPKIDLIKIDVETHEPEVLEGYQKYIKLHQPTILIEILNDEVGQKVQKLIHGIDYVFFNIDENKGIRQVENITKSDYYNYLICDRNIAKQLDLIQ
jgi:FkbM family methyltransferase